MRSHAILMLALTGIMVGLWPVAVRADEPTLTRTRDVIYGRKHGLAMTLDVFAPKQALNGAAVI